jgi:hypothetical protein
MSYLVYIGGFGWFVATFLWIRDARIFFRTALPLYRSAAYWGVAYAVLASAGLAIAVAGPEILGLGIILGALYLQGRRPREKVWQGEGTVDRLLGNTGTGKIKPHNKTL